MIAFLRGRVAGKGAGWCALEVGGVGFRMAMTTSSLASLPAEGDEVIVHTHLYVREDEISLFGFENEAEKAAFESLITVSGVGPKVALATLSALDADELSRAIAAEDVALISSVPGIGKKTAQRIILDLAGKLAGTDTGPAASEHAAGAAVAEVTDALLAMGFSAAEAAAALRGDEARDASAAPELLKHALRRLGSPS